MKSLFLATLSLLLLATHLQAQTTLTLVRDKQALYPIIVAADAIPAEKTAAQQLQQYLQEVTGAQFALLTEDATNANQPQILVGTGNRTKALLPTLDWNALGSDGIVIKTVGDTLVLAGGRPRGTLYAVFEFLEKQAGCRWWTPTEKSIPRKATLEVPPQDTVYTPTFKYREYFTAYVQTDPVFATVMRQNGHHQTQKPEWGGHYNILGFTHTFGKLLPPSKYFKEHPEWYSDPENGHKPCTPASKMPQAQHTQIALSNPEVVEELSKQALLWIKDNPDAGYISISQNDSGNFCETPESLALFKQEGSWSGPLIHFVNQVAERIEREYPGFMVETLAYSRSLQPPKSIRPRSNVIIRLASLHADVGHPLNSDWNEETRKNFLQWADISNQIMVWKYVTNFYGYLLPHPNWSHFATDLRYYAENKVSGVFLEGTHRTNNGVGDFAPLRIWLMSKLMWNPQADQSQIMDEFLHGYYGAAGPHLRAYLDLGQQAYQKTNRKLSAFNVDWTYLTLDDMNQATRLFNQAEAAVKDDTALLARVRRERLSFDLLSLLRHTGLTQAAKQSGQAFLGPQDPQQAMGELVATLKQMRVARYAIDRSLAEATPVLERMFTPPAALPEFAKLYPAHDVIDIQEGNFSLFRFGKDTTLDEDTEASNGQAATTALGWGIQVPMNNVLPGGQPEQWQVYAMVKTQKPGLPPVAGKVSAGLYDVTTRKGITTQSFTLSGNGYERIDLGTHTLGGSMYVWFSPSTDLSVTVDRVILVRTPKP